MKMPNKRLLKKVYNCIKKYIEDSKELWSPATLRVYQYQFKQLPDTITEKPISALTDEYLQGYINKFSVNHKPTTVKNSIVLIKSVIRSIKGKKTSFDITIP